MKNLLYNYFQYRVYHKVSYKNSLQNTTFRSENIPVTHIFEQQRRSKMLSLQLQFHFDLIHMNTFQVLLHIWTYHTINKL